MVEMSEEKTPQRGRGLQLGLPRGQGHSVACANAAGETLTSAAR